MCCRGLTRGDRPPPGVWLQLHPGGHDVRFEASCSIHWSLFMNADEEHPPHRLSTYMQPKPAQTRLLTRPRWRRTRNPQVSGTKNLIPSHKSCTLAEIMIFWSLQSAVLHRLHVVCTIKAKTAFIKSLWGFHYFLLHWWMFILNMMKVSNNKKLSL